MNRSGWQAAKLLAFAGSAGFLLLLRNPLLKRARRQGALGNRQNLLHGRLEVLKRFRAFVHLRRRLHGFIMADGES